MRRTIPILTAAAVLLVAGCGGSGKNVSAGHALGTVPLDGGAGSTTTTVADVTTTTPSTAPPSTAPATTSPPATSPPPTSPPAPPTTAAPSPTTAPPPAPTTTAAPAPSGSALSISGFAFSPTPLHVSVGTKVTVTNNEATSAPHTWTSDTGAWNSGTLSPGQSFSFTFTTAGTFTYHCNIHSSMKGEVDVS